MIYLDNNATTPVRPEALEAMMPYLKNEFGNASSVHQAGQRARKAIEDAREKIARFVGAESTAEIIFTSGGTESNNTAILGALEASPTKGHRIVSSAIEHSSVRTVLKHLAEKDRIDNVVVPVEPNGIVRADVVSDAATPDTALVTIMAANNEVGTFQPIQEIAALLKAKNIPFHTDAVQLAGKQTINAREMGVDMLSLSGHKFGAPKGVGVLYVKKGTRMEALILGGRQERNRRGGTENVAGIVGMAAAAEATTRDLATDVAKMNRLRDLFEDLVISQLSNVSVNGDKTRRAANTSNLCLEYTDSSSLLMALDMKGVACSSGSACQAGSADPSHVLLAMGLPQEKAHASLRFSLGHDTTEENVRDAAAAVIDTVYRLRETHPMWMSLRGGTK